jgi:hypothetical protein
LRIPVRGKELKLQYGRQIPENGIRKSLMQNSNFEVPWEGKHGWGLRVPRPLAWADELKLFGLEPEPWQSNGDHCGFRAELRAHTAEARRFAEGDGAVTAGKTSRIRIRIRITITIKKLEKNTKRIDQVRAPR